MSKHDLNAKLGSRSESVYQLFLVLLAALALFRPSPGLRSDLSALASASALAFGLVISVRLLRNGRRKSVAIVFVLFFAVYAVGLAMSLLVAPKL